MVIVVLLIVVGSIAFLFFASAPPVQVVNINVYAPDNVCGLNANPSGFYGFNSSTGQTQTFDFGMPNYNTTACTIRGVVTNTSGFTLSAIQVPLTIPGNGTGSMNITITSPGSDFSGNLNLILD